jgi:hypothetical protein
MAVIVTGRKLVAELAALPDDMMSFDMATNEVSYLSLPGLYTTLTIRFHS